MTTPLKITLDAGETTGVHYASAGRALGVTLVLGHGAGAGQTHPFMVTVANGLATRGIDVVTFDFPYMAQKRKVPDRAPVLEGCFERVVDAARGIGRTHRLFIGGKSMGGRIATQMAARTGEGIDGIVALGYPLHPPGKPQQLRDEHLPSIKAPVLILQGERDAFGTPAELEPVIKKMRTAVTLHRVTGGDHSFKVSGRKPADVYEEILNVVTTWVRERVA